MSLVIALKDKDRIILAADKQGTLGDSCSHTATKVWDIQGQPEAVMGGVGFAIGNQIIQYSPNWIDKNDICDPNFQMTKSYVAQVIGPTIRQILIANGIEVTPSDEDGVRFPAMPNSFIFAYKDKAWLIGRDLTVEEIGEVEDFFVMGSGSDVAYGSLYSTADKGPFERIAIALEAASTRSITVDDYCEVVTTKQMENDEIDYLKAMYPDGNIEEEIEKAKKAFEEGEQNND